MTKKQKTEDRLNEKEREEYTECQRRKHWAPRPKDTKIDYLFMHCTVEESFPYIMNLLVCQEEGARVSPHDTITEEAYNIQGECIVSGGGVVQSVAEHNVVWHVGKSPVFGGIS